MPVIVELPGQLREVAGGRGDVRLDIDAAPLADVLARLWSTVPALRDRVMDERGRIRPHINVFVDGEDIRYTGGLSTRVSAESEVIILPAVSGGAEQVPSAK